MWFRNTLLAPLSEAELAAIGIANLEPAQRLVLDGRGNGRAPRRATEVRGQRLAARDDRGDRRLDRRVRRA